LGIFDRFRVGAGAQNSFAMRRQKAQYFPVSRVGDSITHYLRAIIFDISKSLANKRPDKDAFGSALSEQRA